MYHKSFLIVGVLALGLLALACTTKTTVLPAERGAPGVSVSGVGSVFGEPDVAILTLGVEAEAASVSAARAEAASAMDAMLTALRSGGVDDADIQTTRFSVEPRFDFIDGRQELRGFFVSNIVTAKIRQIDDAGELIDAAVDAGGDLARVENLRFTIDDPSTLQDEARRLAMQDAKRKAETLTGEADVKLGAPRSISESGGLTPIAFEAAAFDLDAEFQAASRTSIEAGELEVRIQVQVVYGLGE